MPEYRRFVAYFYEYINGKKQKNAGFAKVELRNGMWRILLRLTTEVWPEPPIQVYGFVRESGYLLGFPLGTIRPIKQITEEWAFRADSPIGKDKYRLEDFAGIWIESGDGRCFLTVWDDDAIDPEKFVLELPQEPAEEKRDSETLEEVETVPEQSLEVAGNAKEFSEQELEVSEIEEVIPEQSLEVAGNAEEYSEQDVEISEIEESVFEQGLEVAENAEEFSGQELKASEIVEESTEQELKVSEVVGESIEQELKAPEIVEESADQEFKNSEKSEPTPEIVQEELNCSCIEELFRTCQRFQPFADTEIVNCVMIKPCDIIRLQQDNWKVGRSSFLQHGFYQYRHLLLGMTCDGTYILGVPGIQNPQEKYMAEMFGFGWFKESRRYRCNKVFGYWCRELEQCDNA